MIVVGVGRVVHILNTCFQNSTDVLPFQVIIVKMYKYSYIYTVRVSLLKNFCDTVEVELKKCKLFHKQDF